MILVDLEMIGKQRAHPTHGGAPISKTEEQQNQSDNR